MLDFCSSLQLLYFSRNEKNLIGNFFFFQVRTYISENAEVDVVIHTDHLDDLLEYDLQVSWARRRDLPARFGPRAAVAPLTGARGDLVTDSFCERVFRDCSRTQVRKKLLF